MQYNVGTDALFDICFDLRILSILSHLPGDFIKRGWLTSIGIMTCIANEIYKKVRDVIIYFIHMLATNTYFWVV